MRKKSIHFLASVVLLGLLAGGVSAQTAATPEELAKESEQACAASASVKATPEMVMEKVDKACELLGKEGQAAFGKFRGKNSEFIFGGTYIVLTGMDGTTLMHPVKFKMEGKNTLEIKDANGKAFFVDYVDICKTKGSGWIAYMWPKPGEKTPSQKVTFVKKAVCDGQDIIVGCGIYDVSPDEVATLVGK